MKARALQKFRSALAASKPLHGLWVTLESASITEMAVGLGLDWVVVDAEHGHLDWRDILEHVRAAVRSDTVVLVRVAENNASLVKRALDIGADGVVVPWIENVEGLRQALAAAKYPPGGQRGIGAERATCWGQCFPEHIATANEDVLVVPLIESVEGVRNLPAMLQEPGAEVFFFGPADLSATAGHAGQWEGPGVAESIRDAVRKIRASGKNAGVIASGTDNLKQRADEGFRMIGLGLDAALLIRELQRNLRALGHDRTLSADLVPHLEREWKEHKVVLSTPPENFRPDRSEVMNPIGTGRKINLEPGVVFECLVGAHNGARNLITGIVDFSPRAKLAYHTHPFVESVTVLEGTLMMDIEGRRYRLGPLDNITIPAGTAHGAAAGSTACKAHIAMCTTNPVRELVREPLSIRGMPDDAAGLIGPEYVTRFASARKYVAGPNTQFVDYFNAALIPGCTMSGGFGRFAHKGRLPAHIHDFDESITITEGSATCIVEGRHYTMSDLAAALQPRGRIHYFINDTHEPMAMIWVYAGPMPERIEFEDRLTEPDANPWKE
jgi:2-keto-3-deoxy-L-rhamnonate aldolase RhmA/quercetin dioxygenase-like cupin family protein